MRHKFLQVGGRNSLPLSLPNFWKVAYTQSAYLPSHQSWLLPPPFDRNCSKVTIDLLTAKLSSFFSILNTLPLPLPFNWISRAETEILPSTSTLASHNVWHLLRAQSLSVESVAWVFISVTLSMSSHSSGCVFSDMKGRWTMSGPPSSFSLPRAHLQGSWGGGCWSSPHFNWALGAGVSSLLPGKLLGFWLSFRSLGPSPKAMPLPAVVSWLKARLNDLEEVRF